MPWPSHTHHQPTSTTSTIQNDDTRTSPQTRRQVLLHHHTTFWTSRTSGPTSTLWQSFLQHLYHQHSDTERHHFTYRHLEALSATPITTTTDSYSTHHHIHRRFLSRWRQSDPMLGVVTNRGHPEPRSSHDQRMGSSSLPSWCHQAASLQRHRPTEPTQTLRKQQSTYLLLRSMGSDHHSHPSRTTTHIHLRTTMRQRRSHSCYHQRLREPRTFKQPPRIPLDLAQQKMHQTDIEAGPNTCQYRRPIQQRRLLHRNPTPMASPWTTDNSIARNYQEDHWQRWVRPPDRFYPRQVRPTIPRSRSTETGPFQIDQQAPSWIQVMRRVFWHYQRDQQAPFWIQVMRRVSWQYQWPNTELESRWHGSFGPLRRVWTDDGSEIFIQTHRSQWPRTQFTRLHRLQFYHFSENTDSKNPVWDETVPNPNSWRPRAKHPTNILVWRKKSVLPACLRSSRNPLKHLKWLLVSTYLFVRCNNHKCVERPLWRGQPLTFTWVIHNHVYETLLVAHFGYKHPFDFRPFVFFPRPPSPHFIHTYIILHVFHSPVKYIFRRCHLQFFRLGFDSCLHIRLLMYFGSEIFIHTHRSQWPRTQFTRLHRLQFYHFSENTDSKNPVWDETVPNPNSWRPRAKHPTNILVWRKKSVLPACLRSSRNPLKHLKWLLADPNVYTVGQVDGLEMDAMFLEDLMSRLPVLRILPRQLIFWFLLILLV